jgi:hypothetical protein
MFSKRLPSFLISVTLSVAKRLNGSIPRVYQPRGNPACPESASAATSQPLQPEWG